MHQIIEIKARCQDPTFVREKLQAHQAEFKGLDHQIDTYFKVNNGRLKLREGNIENNLIHYHRPNHSGPKRSEVTLCPVESNSNLKAALTAANGILTVVDKKREIYFKADVKFHIDEVQGLGSFVEIEVIDWSGQKDLEELRKTCSYWMNALGVKDGDLEEVSYSDMLLDN